MSDMTEADLLEGDEYELTEYSRDLLTLRRHARAIARHLGSIGVPRGETTQALSALVRAGIVDAYNDLAFPDKS